MSFSSSRPSSTVSEAACHRPSHRKDFQIAIICALPLEYDAVTLLVDEFWDEDDRQYGRTSGDANTYRNGRIGMHNVVLMLLPNMGKAAVAGSAASLRTSYSSLRIAFLVGICGGVPFLGSQEALLGDVVIGEAIVQYDFGRQYPGEFVPKEAVDATQNMPNKDIRTLLAYFKSETGTEDLRTSTAKHLRSLQQTAEMRRYRRSYHYPGFTEDRLFAAAYRHRHQNRSCCDGAGRFCDEAAKSSCADVGCDKKQLVSRRRLEAKRCLKVEDAQCPEIYIGRIASADTVMKSGVHRDQIAKQHNIVAFEMEGAGIWDEAPCVVVKGICDYADSHKNKSWQPFAAATAAAVLKAMLGRYTMTDDAETLLPRNDSGQQGRLLQANVELAGTSRTTMSPASGLVLRKPHGTETLQVALYDFQAILTHDQRCELRNARKVPDADGVLTFTAELDLHNRNRKGPSIASRLYSLLQSVRDFSAVAETTHNELASHIWGSVRLTLLISITKMSYYERLSKNFMELGRLFPRRQAYQIHYSSSTQLQKALCGFYASFLRYCKRTVQAAQGQWPRDITSDLRSPLQQEFKQHAVDMEIHSRDVDKAIALAAAKAHDQNRQLQTIVQKKSSKSRKLKRMLSQDNDNPAMVAELQSEVDGRRAMERRQKLLHFLSTHDYVTPLKQSRRKRYSGTLEWLFKTREFDRWINDSESPLLWCSGKIGSGKTILTASLIDKLLTEKQGPDEFVSFFFIQFDDQQSMIAETILKSIVQQALHASNPPREIETLLERMKLSLSSGLEDILELLRKIAASFRTFYIAIDGLDECSKQERGDLLRILSLVATGPNIKLFLAGRDSVSAEIQKTFTAADNHLSMGCVSVQADIATYVEGIVQDKLQSEELIVEDLSLIGDIKVALTEGADGMFLWVSFQIDELALQRCDDDIRRAISNLPKDLEETFDRVLDRIVACRNGNIAKQVSRWVAAAKEPLCLDQLGEIIPIEIGQPYLKPERRLNGMKHISSWCENLVHVDEELKTVQFVHQSVQQFFIEKSHEARHNQFLINIEDADHYIGEICVTYLNLNDFKKTLARRQQPLPPMPPIAMAGTALRPQWKAAAAFSSLWKFNLDTRGGLEAATAVEATTRDDKAGVVHDSIEVGHPFLTYASTYWIFHTTRFERGKSKTWNLWEAMIRDGHDLAKRPWDEGESSKSSTALLESNNTALLKWSCKYGHYAVARLLVQAYRATTEDKNQVLFEAASQGDLTLLDIVLEAEDPGLKIDHSCELAVQHDHLEILRRLVAAGANGQAALLAAAHSGKEDAIEYLLTVSDGQIAMQAAIENNDREAVRHLVRAGVDIQNVSEAAIKAGNHEAIHCLRSAGVDGQVLLQAAMKTGNIDSIQNLLAAGADNYFLLEAAARDGDRDLFKYLLNARVDGETALRVAARPGHRHIVEKILAAGAYGSSDLKAPARNGDLDALRREISAGVDSAEELCLFIFHGSLDEIRNLLAAGLQVNAEGSRFSEYSALQLAVMENRPDVFDALLDAGANINAISQNEGGETVLHTAVQQGRLDMVEKVIAAGADVNMKAARHRGRTVLQSAAENGHMDIVKVLLSAGADVKTESVDEIGRTALQAAAGRGHLEIAKLLLDAGADVNAAPSQQLGQPALHAALNGGHPDVALMLLNTVAGVNTELKGCRETALQIASAKGYSNIVRILLDAGADVNAKPTEHYQKGSALQAAAAEGHSGIVEMLLAAGVDVDAVWPTINQGRTALHNAAENGHPDIVGKLLYAGADVNAQPTTYYGQTALRAAARHGHHDVVERLLAAGADVNAKGPTFNRGNTALQDAVLNGHLQVVESLLNAGADVNAFLDWIESQTPLQAAAMSGDLGVLERLLDAGADVNAKHSCGYGITALEAAATREHTSVVSRLLAAGAEIDPKWAASHNGQSAVHCAAEQGYVAVVERLLAAGAQVDPVWAASYKGLSAVQISAKEGYPGIVERLLDAGAGIDGLWAASEEGRAAVIDAWKKGYPKAAESILAAVVEGTTRAVNL
ncbi:hypothetical protein TgHK011_009786 [Trichoderma gracile]|nr:hypothetical protein TgHK011_009786 [Trichoderma gracile]